MSGESSQSGWNSWFGPSGEPAEGADSKPGRERGPEQEQTGESEAPQRESGLPKRRPRVAGRESQAARIAEDAQAATTAGTEPESQPEPETEAATGESAEVRGGGETEAGDAGADESAAAALDDAETVSAASVLAALSGVETGGEQSESGGIDAAGETWVAARPWRATGTGAERDIDTRGDDTTTDAHDGGGESGEGDAEDGGDAGAISAGAIGAAPAEASTWSAPPAGPYGAQDETALARPVRLEPDQDLLATRLVADGIPTQLVPPVSDEADAGDADAQSPSPVSPTPWPRASEPADLWAAAREPFAGRRDAEGEARRSPYQGYGASRDDRNAARDDRNASRNDGYAGRDDGYAGRGEGYPARDDGYAAQRAPYGRADSAADDERGERDSGPTRRESPATAAAGHGGGSGGAGAPRRRSRGKVAAGSVGGLVAAGLAVLLVTNLMGSGSNTAAKPSGFQPTATAPADAAKETADAFLAAWSSGKFQQAAALTDDPSQALSTLTSFTSNLHLTGLGLASVDSTAESIPLPTQGSTAAPATASETQAGVVTFSVMASVGLAGAAGSAAGTASGSPAASAAASSSAAASPSATSTAKPPTAAWSYQSKLTAYERAGGWWIQWTPGLVAPNLTSGMKVVSVAIPPQADEVADSSGNGLAGAADAGLRNIAAALKKNAVGQGTPGIKIELQKADGTVVAGTVTTLSQPQNTGMLKTTIDAQVETAAMHAVSMYPQSSMVVIQPSTGDILAVANNAGGNDFALTARIAPGSTNKIITSTALMTSGLVSSTSQAVECPKTVSIDGQTFGNSQGESLPPSTPFLEDFADSCNNAFTQWYSKIGSTTLAQTAQKYYGLNQQWDIGLGPAGPYYNILPSSSRGELAMELFGQGQLEAAPLAMASVAATVANGSFKQPIVVPGQAQLGATPLPADVQQNLWKMMHAVTQSGGTAAGVYSGVNDPVYAKTGTADHGDATQKANSWMVVFDPKKDIAIGCVVLGAGFGASYAGPETAAVLKALQ